MRFGEALEHLRYGACAARDGWHGKNMYIVVLSGKQLADGLRYVDYMLPHADEFRDSIVLYTGDGKATVGWLASQEDMLSDDWFIIQRDELNAYVNVKTVSINHYFEH